MSNYVVIARFDGETEAKILSMLNELKAEGYSVPEWPPHITLAAYEDIPEKLIRDYTADFARSHKSFSLRLSSLSILPPGGQHMETAVLCLNPAHSKSFVDFYYEFHEKYEEYCTGIGSFNSVKSDSPAVHATLAVVGLKKLQKAMDIILTRDVFVTAKIERLELYTYPMRLIESFELR